MCFLRLLGATVLKVFSVTALSLDLKTTLNAPDLLQVCAYRTEAPGDLPVVDALHAAAFGPGRFARSAFRLREGKIPRYECSWLAHINESLVGAVRLTDIRIGKSRALLLGPLCTRPDLQGQGIGRALMARAMQTAAELNIAAVLLIGDLEYYAPFGFHRTSLGQVLLPGPADPRRILIAPLSGDLSHYSGTVR